MRKGVPPTASRTAWRRLVRIRSLVLVVGVLCLGCGIWWHLWGRPHAYFLRLARNAETATVPEDATGFRRSEVRQDDIGIRITMKWEFSMGIAWQEYGPWVNERLVNAGYSLKSEGPGSMVFLRTFPGDQTTVTIERDASSGQMAVQFNAGPW